MSHLRAIDHNPCSNKAARPAYFFGDMSGLNQKNSRPEIFGEHVVIKAESYYQYNQNLPLIKTGAFFHGVAFACNSASGSLSI